jgi:hypothetical protein
METPGSLGRLEQLRAARRSRAHGLRQQLLQSRHRGGPIRTARTPAMIHTVVSLRRRGSRKRCKVSGERRARRLNGSAVLSHQPGSASAAPCSSRRRHAATAVRTKMPRSACATTIEIPPPTQPACTQARPHRSPMLMGVFEYLVCAWLGLSQPPQPTTQCAPLPAQPRRRAGPPDRRWPPQPPHATAATATQQPRHARTHATISYSA